jgi:hypothetical protein
MFTGLRKNGIPFSAVDKVALEGPNPQSDNSPGLPPPNYCGADEITPLDVETPAQTPMAFEARWSTFNRTTPKPSILIESTKMSTDEKEELWKKCKIESPAQNYSSLKVAEGKHLLAAKYANAIFKGPMLARLDIRVETKSLQPKLLVLALDGLLISMAEPRKVGCRMVPASIHFRPGMTLILEGLQQYFQIALYEFLPTTQVTALAEKILPDPSSVISLGIEYSRILPDGQRCKDLSIFPWEPKDIIIVDLEPKYFCLNLANGIALDRWDGAGTDKQLHVLSRFLVQASKNVDSRLNVLSLVLGRGQMHQNASL